jgi:signal transduction histidine kinase/ligand-binding sensor domain-containing protein
MYNARIAEHSHNRKKSPEYSTSKKVAETVGFVLLLLLLSLTSVLAERLPLKVYTTADGLGSSSIIYIMRDSRGFLWFCTRDGLSRFDGIRFTTYRIGRNPSYPTINHILETRKGDYLIATSGGGIYRFDPNVIPASSSSLSGDDTTDRLILNAEKVSETSVAVMYEDRAGNLWAGNGGLFQLEETATGLSFHQVELNLPETPGKSFTVFGFKEGRDGSLWLITRNSATRRLPDGRTIQYILPIRSSEDAVSALEEDEEGRMWIGHIWGLYVVNPEPLASLSGLGKYTERRLPFPENDVTFAPSKFSHLEEGGVLHFVTGTGLGKNPVTGLLQASDGRMWIADNRGLTVFDGARMQNFSDAQGITENSGGVLAEDIEGNLWVGNESGGARKLLTSGMTTFDKTDGLGDLRIHSIYEDQKGDLYVVSGSYFISRFDGVGFKTLRPQIPPDARVTRTSNVGFRDSQGDWWMPVHPGLYRFSNIHQFEELAARRPILYTESSGFKSDRFYRVFEDRNGDIWISMRSSDSALSGLTRWARSDNTFQSFTDAEGFPSMVAASAFAEDGPGNLWVGFYEGTLARYAGGRFTVFTMDDGVPEGVIAGLYLDRGNRLWIASSMAGLSRVDDPAAVHPIFKTYTIDNGLSSNNVRSITEDLAGNIYVGTVRGVDRLSPATGKIHHYGLNDGLADDFVNVAFHDSKGVLWFGTPRGLSRLRPEPVAMRNAPSILISGVRIAGVKRPLSELGQAEITVPELNHTQNNIQVEFFSLDFSLGENIRYQYKLEGLDADWSRPSILRSVNYPKIGPGNYRFLVRAINPDGTLSAMPAFVSFTILRPIWQRWWFLLLVTIFVVSTIYALHKYRLTKLLEIERTRTRIATDLHDDIGASLSRIAMLSEVVKRQNGTPGKDSSRRLTQIADNARDLVDSMSDIVWSTDPNSDSLSSVIERLRSFAADTLGEGGVKWKLEIGDEVAEIYLSSEKRRGLYLILKEAVVNIARHANCDHAEIKISVNHTDLIAEISDDGKGLTNGPNGDSRGGHGLQNMSKRAEELGGQLGRISSEKGTKFVLIIPRSESKSMDMLFRLLRTR